jgi:hypothetical protein
MTSTCPVCGKGEWEYRRVSKNSDEEANRSVSHLACVENIYTANLSLRVRVQQAEAECGSASAEIGDIKRELAALEGRRCFDCKLFTYTDCPVWPAFHRGETVDTLPSDYHCSLWTPRKDGES